MSKIDEQLEKLKEKYSGVEDQEKLKEWEKKHRELLEMEAYIEMKPTQHLIKRCKDEITAINKTLLEERELDKIKRKALFHERRVWRQILKLYNPEGLEKAKERFNSFLQEHL